MNDVIDESVPSSDAKAGTLPPLPALRSLGELADLKPTIVVDTREQLPLRFIRLKSVKGTLNAGDYSFIGGETMFGIERKSVADLVACCVGENRARFERELVRLRGFRFKRLLVVGAPAEVTQHRYRSSIAPKVILSTLAALEVRYDLPVVWSPTPEDAAVMVEGWVWWYAREIVKSANALLAGAGEQDVALN